MNTTIAYGLPRHNGHTPEALFPLAPVVPATPALPEAACSVNLFFDVPGYGKAQATGRGTSPGEAAANLRDTIAATRSALAPPAPAKPRLADLLACGLERAIAKGDLGRVERLAKAAALVLTGAVHPAGMGGRYMVDSRTTPGLWYDVDASGTCGCKDFQHHATEDTPWWCLHGLAVMMTIRLNDTVVA